MCSTSHTCPQTSVGYVHLPWPLHLVLSVRKAGGPELVDAALQTIAYMPPELLGDRRLSFLVDVYSFGIIMHECFTGKVRAQPAHGILAMCACPDRRSVTSGSLRHGLLP